MVQPATPLLQHQRNRAPAIRQAGWPPVLESRLILTDIRGRRALTGLSGESPLRAGPQTTGVAGPGAGTPWLSPGTRARSRPLHPRDHDGAATLQTEHGIGQGMGDSGHNIAIGD